MLNTLLKEKSNNINQLPITSEEEYNEILFKLIDEIHKKYVFTRSKL